MDVEIFLNRLSPFVRRAMFFKTRDFVLKPRVIFDYELMYAAKGKMEIEINGKREIISMGDIVLFRPGVEHSMTCVDSEEVWLPHLHFDAEYHADYRDLPINFKKASECTAGELAMIRWDILGSGRLNIPDIIRIDNHSEILKYINLIIEAYKINEVNSMLIQKALVLKLLYSILKGLSIKADAGLGRHQNTLHNAAVFIIENYNKSIINDQLARLCCLSISYFQKLFYRQYGVSPIQYQIRYRMEKAKEYLTYSQMSITEIADRTGYESIHSFSKAFKEAEYVSPREFRRLHFGEKINQDK